MSIVYTNNLDMHSGGVPLIVHLGQYDSDFSLVFNLYSSVGALTIESGTTAEIRGTKSDGFGYSADATIDIVNKKVTVAGSNQMTAAARQNIFELVLLKNNKVLSSANFILDVEHAALDADTIQDESVLKELNAIIEGAATATQAAEDAEDAADRAEEAADDLSGTVQQVATNTQDIANLKDDLSEDVALYTDIPAIDTILFTTSDVSVGDKITYKIVMPSTGQKTGYIGLYDANNNRLAYYGRGAGVDPTTVFEGVFEIPSTFSYSKWYGSGTPVSLSITKKVFFTGFVHYDMEQALTDEQKTTAQTNIGVESVPEMYDFLKDSLGNSSGNVDISDYPDHLGWLTGENKWMLYNKDGGVYVPTYHIIIPVVVGEEIILTTNADRGIYMALFSNYTTPVDNASAPVVSGYGREYVQPNTTKTFTVPANAVYLYLGMNSGIGGRFSVKSLIIPSAVTVNTLPDVIDNSVYGDGVSSITFDTPTAILSNRDPGATSLDNGWLEYFNIIQISESMYYMYYCGVGSSAGSGDYPGNLLFAHSTNGMEYTRGFPTGITPPFAGSNKVFTSVNPDNITGQSVFKCCDPVYPFRLICQQKEGSSNHYINMYKSMDGINFDLSTKRTLRKEYHDNQICVVPRGDVLKIYFRENVSRVVNGVSHHSRELSVMFFDLEGNQISPRKDLSLQFVYDSAATAINDVEELIFPTNFDDTEVGGISSQAFLVDVYRVDKYHVTPVQSNLDAYFGENDKFVVFAPGFITINNEQYIAFKTQNIEHDDYASSDPSTRTATYKLAKITLAF